MPSDLIRRRTGQGAALAGVFGPLVAWLVTGLGQAARAAEPVSQPLCAGEQQFLGDRIAITRQALAANRYRATEGVRAELLSLPGAVLAGWQVAAHDGGGRPVAPRGYLLVLPGDAMLAQDMIPMARALAAQAYDVYSYDHRGFGASSGQAGIGQAMRDVRALVEHLNAQVGLDGRPLYRRRLVYGLSAGAALGLNALRAGLAVDGFVADGLPASLTHRVRLLGLFTLSWLDCPPAIEPVNLFATPLPVPVVLLQGGDDRQLALTQRPPAQQRLLVRACRAGANVVQVQSWQHPTAGGPRDERTRLLASYLAADGRMPLGRPGALTRLDRPDAASLVTPADCGDEPVG